MRAEVEDPDLAYPSYYLQVPAWFCVRSMLACQLSNSTSQAVLSLSASGQNDDRH